MDESNPVEDLFGKDLWINGSPREILNKLGRYGIWNLAYDTDLGCNPGHIFRGEAAFKIPLQCGLERDWRKNERGDGELTRVELRAVERNSLVAFLEGKGPELARYLDPSDRGKSWDDVWWWLSLMQHYSKETGAKTRLIDFTRDIRMALYFAIEQHDQSLEQGENRDLLIYCVPCKDMKHPHDREGNKCPIQPTERLTSVDMNLVIACEIDPPWMEPHKKSWYPNGTLHKEYFQRNGQQWGWDQPYYPNRRIAPQKGMFIYPYDYPISPLRKSGESWLVRNLRSPKAYSKDPFNVSDLPPKRLRIPGKSANDLKHLLADRCQLTRDTVYGDLTRE